MYQRDYDKPVFIDFEATFTSNSRPDWKYCQPVKRILTYKIGTGPVHVVDFWQDFPDKDLLSRIQGLLASGASLASKPEEFYRIKLEIEPLLKRYNELTFEHPAYKEIEQALKDGYHLVGQNIVGFDCLYPLIPPSYLDYIADGKLFDTMVAEQIINGLTTPLEKHIKSTVRITEDAEEVEEEEEMSGNSLEDLAWRYAKTALEKKYQHASFYKKHKLQPEVLKYAETDVLILEPIYTAQVQKLKELKLEQMMNFSMELHLTTYIAHWKGVYIDTEKLVKHTKKYEQIHESKKKRIESLLPEVPYTDAQLRDMYIDTIWVPRSGAFGITNKTKAKKIIDDQDNHMLYTSFIRWKSSVGETLTKPAKITNPQHRKYCFNKLGYKIPDTKDETLRSFVLTKEAPIIDEYLEYQEANSLLTKTLYKFTRKYYLREGNTVGTKYKMVRPTNWRTASAEPNIQQLSRDLKDLYGCPPGWALVDFDLSAIELFMVLQDYPEMDLINVMLDDSADLHCYLGARYFTQDYQVLLNKKNSGDKSVKPVRNASKTVTYFNVYKSPSDPSKRFITGTNKLISIFESQLNEKRTKEEAEIMLTQAERSFGRWTVKKKQIDQVVSQAYHKDNQVIAARGPLGHRSLFRVCSGKTPLYSIDDYGNPYINSRSLYSCAIAGKIAVAAKEALRRIQLELYKKFGPDKAYLPLFVHDSYCAYCLPEIKYEVKEIVIRNMLQAMKEIAGFTELPVRIEGNVTGDPVETWEITKEGVIRQLV